MYRKNWVELILRPPPDYVDLMKTMCWVDEAICLKVIMTRQLPRQAFTASASASLVIALGTSVLISSRYSEWKNACIEAQAYANVNRSLEEARRSLQYQSAIKRGTIADLAAGRITLEEATAMCLVIDDGWPLIRKNISTMFPGSSDSEREARLVISLACKQAPSPAERQTLIDRLNAEFTLLFPNAMHATRAALQEELSRRDAW
jgi:hypothetical protein